MEGEEIIDLSYKPDVCEGAGVAVCRCPLLRLFLLALQQKGKFRGFHSSTLLMKQRQTKAERTAKATKGSIPTEGSFISFSDVVSRPVENSSPAPIPVYMGTDPTLSVIAKKLSKKNSTTRLKALTELKDIAQENPQQITSDFISFFVFMYDRVLLDNDRNVRENLNIVLGHFLKIDRKMFKSFVETIIGPLYVHTCDPVGSVSQSAIFALEALFPNPQKRLEVLSTHCSLLLNSIREILDAKPETLSDMTLSTIEEAEERFERVLNSSLHALAKLISTLPVPVLDGAGLSSIVCVRFWKKISSKRSVIRQATLLVLIELCNFTPGILSKSVNSDQIVNFLLVALSEERLNSNIPDLLRALIFYFKTFPQCLTISLLDISFFPQLQELLKSHFELSSPAVLPLFASIPLPLLFHHEERLNLFLEALFQIPAPRNQVNISGLMTCTELSAFLAIQGLKTPDDEIPLQFIAMLLSVLARGSISLLSRGDYANLVPLFIHLHRLSVSPKTSHILESFWNSLSESLQKLFLEKIALGFSGDFLNLIKGISNLFSFLGSEQIGQDIFGALGVILSFFNFSNSHLTMLSTIKESISEISEFGMIWSYSAVRMGFLVWNAFKTNSDKLLHQLEALISFLASPVSRFAASYYLNLEQETILNGNSLFEFALSLLESTYDLSWNIGNFESATVLTNFSSKKLFTSLTEQIYLHRSILEFSLALKVGIISVCTRTESINPDILCWVKTQIEHLLSSHAKTDLATQVALLLYVEKTELFPDLRLEKFWDSSVFMWKELSRVHNIGFEEHLNDDKMDIILCEIARAFSQSHDSSSSRNLMITKHFQILTSWKDIELSLLPRLSSDSKIKLMSSIASSLKFNLLRLVDGSTSNSILVDAQILSSHVSLFLKLTMDGIFGAVDLDRMDVDLGFGDLGLWVELSKNPTQFGVCSILKVVFQFELAWAALCQESCYPQDGLIYLFPLHKDPALCLQIFRTLLTSRDHLDDKDMINDAIGKFQGMITRTIQSKFEYVQFTSDLILASQIPYENCCHYEHAIIRDSLSLIFRSSEYFAPRVKDKSSTVDFISMSQPKGKTAYYLAKEPQHDEFSTLIIAQSAIVLEYDHRPNENPFFTLGFPDSREIQTEANRVILPSTIPGFLHRPDLVRSNIPSIPPQSQLTSLDFLLERLSNDLYRLCQAGFDQSVFLRIFEIRIQPMLLYFTQLSPVLNSLGLESSEYSVSLVGFIRHSLIQLLELHPLSNLNFIQCGLDLLSALCTTKLICGSGLWIHCMIPSMWRIFQTIKTSKLILSQEERLQYLNKLLATVSTFLSSLPSSYITELAVPVLELAILELEDEKNQSNTPQILESSLECAENIWTIQSLESKINNCFPPLIQNWEKRCFEKCIHALFRSLQTEQGIEVNGDNLQPPSLRALDAAIQFRESAFSPILNEKFTPDDKWRAWNIISNPHIHISARCSLAKILYIWSNAVIPRVEISPQEETVNERLLLENILGVKFLSSFESNLETFLKIENNMSENGVSTGFKCSCGDHLDSSLLLPSFERYTSTIYSPVEVHIDLCGIFFQWLTILKSIETYFQNSMDWVQRASIGNYVSKSNLLGPLFSILVRIQHYIQSYNLLSITDLSKSYYSLDCTGSFTDLDQTQVVTLASFALWRTIYCLPGAIRMFYLESCLRSESATLEKFVELTVNESLLRREASIIAAYQQNKSDGDQILSVRCSITPGEITTSYIADEVSIEMTIHIPKTYPLRNVEVECKRRMGISEGRWRRWTLQIIQLLAQSDGSVLDAILLWKKNVDKEFEGVEPCPICYSVLDSKSLSLPTLQCPTCKNKFHPTCLYKWFNTSGKSKCVLCQQPFFN